VKREPFNIIGNYTKNIMAMQLPNCPGNIDLSHLPRKPFSPQVNMVVGPAKITPPIPNILDSRSPSPSLPSAPKSKQPACLRGKQRAVSFLCHLFALKGPETA
jgi:hypothetical protein